jgi:hypothetical protein
MRNWAGPSMRIERLRQDLWTSPIASTGGGGDKMSVTERRKRDIPVINAVADGDAEHIFNCSAAPMLIAMQSVRRVVANLEATPEL